MSDLEGQLLPKKLQQQREQTAIGPRIRLLLGKSFQVEKVSSVCVCCIYLSSLALSLSSLMQQDQEELLRTGRGQEGEVEGTKGLCVVFAPLWEREPAVRSFLNLNLEPETHLRP